MANVPPPSLKQSLLKAWEPGSTGELLQLQMKFAPKRNASVEGSVENVPPKASQSACDCANVPDPLSGAAAEALALAAVSVAVSVAVLLAGAYWTVMLQDLPGPRLRPVQVSAVAVNAAEPGSVIVIAPEALSPVLVSVNACVVVVPESIGPAVHDEAVKLSDGAALLASAAGVKDSTPRTARLAMGSPRRSSRTLIWSPSWLAWLAREDPGPGMR